MKVNAILVLASAAAVLAAPAPVAQPDDAPVESRTDGYGKYSNYGNTTHIQCSLDQSTD